MTWIQKKLHLVIFGILALIIMYPLFSDGFIFTLDAPLSPNINARDAFSGLNERISPSDLFLFLEVLVNHIIPIQLFQKIIYFLVFFISALAMYQLPNTQRKLPRYFAAILYMVNPFLYTRFMVGHLGLLISYALFPYVISSIIKFYNKPSLKQTIKTALWLSIIGIQIQYILFSFLILAIFFIYFATKKYLNAKKNSIPKKEWINYRQILLLILFFIILNSYWLLPLFINQNQVGIDVIATDDLVVYGADTELRNILMTTAMMYGFWRQDAYVLPTQITPDILLIGIFVILLYLCINGYISSKDRYKTPFLIIGLISLFFAVGVEHKLTESAFTFLFNHFPFFKSLREPNKFIGLLLIMYCYLGSLGFDSLLKHQSKMKYLAPIILILPFVYTPTMFGSFMGQISSTPYPEDWHQINSYLNNDPQDFNTLSLPWHMYMDYHWINNSHKRTYNLAKDFFDKPIIVGDNVEAWPIYSKSTSERSRYIESLIGNSSVIHLGNKLKILNVKYILLTKEVDYQNYLYLLNQSDLKLIINSTNFYVFKNLVKVSKFYQSDDLIMLEPLNYSQESIVTYHIDQPKRKYIIFTDNYNFYWNLGSQKPMWEHFVNVFEYRGENKISFKRFNLMLTGYFISSFGLFILLRLLYAKKF